MSPRPVRKQRTIRVEDGIWHPAQAAADQNNETLSDAVRQFLKSYAKKGGQL